MDLIKKNRRHFIQDAGKASLLSLLPLQLSGNNKKEIQEPAFRMLTEPYLQYMDFDAVSIMWISSKPSISWVESGPSEQTDQTHFGQKHGLKAANNRVHTIRLTGLAENQTYQYFIYSKEIIDFQPYKVVFGETIKKGPYTFTTPFSSAKATSFVVFNDLHDHPDNITELMGKFCAEKDYEFVVFNGDAFNWVDDEETIVKDLLTPIGKMFGSSHPFLMIQGNHEVRGKYARQLFDYFDYPSDSSYYAFTRGPVRFIVLDSGEDKDDTNSEYSGLVAFDPYREEQARWLEQEIAGKEYQKALFKVVFIHIPVFHAGEGHGTLHCRQLFNPLFNKGKIDLAISGHTHRFGTFDADPATHNYPILIGGGPGFVGRGGGTRTIIKAKATGHLLSVDMYIDDGSVVGSYRIRK